MTKPLYCILVAVLLLSLTACQQAPHQRAADEATSNAESIWTEADRAYLLENLTLTKQGLLDATEGLTADQWRFKSDADTWSIAEVVEHLALIESYYFRDLLYGQYTPERPELVAQVTGNDEAFVAYENDPGTATAALYATPTGMFETGDELMNYFTRFRDQVIELVTSTDSDLRLHFAYRAPGSGIWEARDLHQYTLTLISHAARHTNQINRIKTAANYPGR
ncbi:MAG: DinB family protein [Bacteroidota bacterium]